MHDLIFIWIWDTSLRSFHHSHSTLRRPYVNVIFWIRRTRTWGRRGHGHQ
jgi:hypothetical protein